MGQKLLTKECNHPCCGVTCRKPPKEKKIYYLKRTPLKRTSHQKIHDTEVEKWFDYRIKNCEAVCENCKATAEWFKKEPYLKLFRAAQAHILPKRNFPSIAAHPLNGMVLFAGYSGVCSCHDDFDASWLSASKMPVWKIAVERFKVIYPFISEEELRFIPKELLKEI